MGSSLSSTRVLYCYVPKQDIDSVIENGLMSARQLHNFAPERTAVINRDKYLHQMNKVASHPDFGPSFAAFKARIAEKQQVSQLSEAESIMAYLDWRNEDDERGSEYIYGLFAPIPPDIVNNRRFQQTRGDIVRNRVLVKFNAGDLPIKLIEADETSRPDDFFDYFATRSVEYWTDLWLKSLQSEEENTLWFEGIPHAMIRIKHPVNVQLV